MCGIFALLNLNSTKISRISIGFKKTTIENAFMKGQRRGPEFSKLTEPINNAIFGFHRLAINGLNSDSNQPFDIDNILLICNGEIYNYKYLYDCMNVTPNTNSDCEVIIHLYKKYGIEQTLVMLDGVFAFILYDKTENKIYVARDPMGVRPLYILKHTLHNFLDDDTHMFKALGFASELKCLSELNKNRSEIDAYTIHHVTPGTYSVYNHDCQRYRPSLLWKASNIINKPYYLPTIPYTTLKYDKYDCYPKIVELLVSAVVKRCETTERDVACLLSGGLDSSLIAAIVANHFRIQGKTIETYSIGLEGSEDIKYARMVADYIGSKHHEVIVTEDDMFNAIPEVIEAIESYDTTTVRASIGNYLIGKYIASHSQAKVIFNGDGSDELFGGYLYMNKCPDDIEFDKEIRRLLQDIHLFDVLRSDKCISSNGLEPRTPFLDKSFVNYVLSIPIHFKNHAKFKSPEKELLRRAFNDYFDDSFGRKILPDQILWRRKEAFSDGVSCQGRSLYIILQEKIRDYLNNEDLENKENKQFNASIETEKIYYKKIFNKLYPESLNIVPYFWMPKYTDATDPSARTLQIY